MSFGGVGVDPASRRQRRVLATLGLLVGRSILLLGLPVVADLLVGVLQRGERHLMRAPFVTVVLVDGRVVCLRERLLGLRSGALQRARKLILDGLTGLGRLG